MVEAAGGRAHLGRTRSGELLNPSGETATCTGDGCNAIGPLGSRHYKPKEEGEKLSVSCGWYGARPSRSKSVLPPQVERVERIFKPIGLF